MAKKRPVVELPVRGERIHAWRVYGEGKPVRYTLTTDRGSYLAVSTHLGQIYLEGFLFLKENEVLRLEFKNHPILYRDDIWLRIRYYDDLGKEHDVPIGFTRDWPTGLMQWFFEIQSKLDKIFSKLEKQHRDKNTPPREP